ncbi:ABC transporter substrate-binding protein [Bifidobacterium asteroides]|uniref:Solute-binding protein family 5 domain-containing protein n=1 Tax=Bifidobacterium asteroides TaxID=1684 RepID=A0A6N7TVA0_9BIFI|nr:ABC transporter substrate-binding protein [Bifidobacterium asteroides]MSD90637.1 hypothetical protein [Bifidobacterium asteroides]
MARGRHKQIRSGIIFFLVLAVLTAGTYMAWPLVTGQGGWRLPWAQEGSGRIVRIRARQAPVSLDIRTEPGRATDQALMGNVYQTLTRPDAKGRPTPGLAQNWEVSANGLLYTFHLRNDARFADGRRLTSEDALWSLHQIIDHQYQGHRDLDGLARVTNPDDATLVIGLKSPNARLLTALSGRAGIVYDRQARVNYSTRSAGSGPYQVDDWQPGTSLTLTANKSYRGPDKAAIGKVIFTYTGSPQETIKDLDQGRLDAVVDLDPATAAQAHKKPTATPSTDNVVLAFNNIATSPLSDQHMREAVRYALDREAVAKLEGGGAKALGGPLNQLSPGYDPDLQAFPFDRAQAIHRSSYYRPSFFKNGLRLVYPREFGSQVGELMRTQLKAAGIPTQVSMVDQPTFRDQVLNRRDYDMALMVMDNDEIDRFADPDSTMLFDNVDVQNSWKQVTDCTDQNTYAERLKAFARQVSDLSPSDWLYQRTPLVLTAPRLQGMPSSLLDRYLPLWNLRIQG